MIGVTPDEFQINVREKGRSRMENPETLASLDTQHTERRQTKHTKTTQKTQKMNNTDPTKN
jgi:hypothetical protein